jgi:hypothetical protein
MNGNVRLRYKKLISRSFIIKVIKHRSVHLPFATAKTTIQFTYGHIRNILQIGYFGTGKSVTHHDYSLRIDCPKFVDASRHKKCIQCIIANHYCTTLTVTGWKQRHE